MIKILKEWFKLLKEARARRAARIALNRLTDQELQDLGIGSSYIHERVPGIR